MVSEALSVRPSAFSHETYSQAADEGRDQMGEHDIGVQGKRRLFIANSSMLMPRWFFSAAAAFALLLTPAASSRAQSPEAQPQALGKERARLYVLAMHSPLANLEGNVNHLAVLSETCRIEHGAKACGLSDKPLESSKLEERYAYYVKDPVDARSNGKGVKVQRRNWQGSSAPPRQ
jgi:hypothetical protein